MKRRTIRCEEDIVQVERLVRSAAEATSSAVRDLLGRLNAVDAMAAMKFEAIGHNPLSDDRWNIVEQLNQMFTYLATCEALRYLFRVHPEAAPYVINLGTSAGSDIIAHDGSVAAEVFAATHPASNDKLRKDAAKVFLIPAKHRYVFYSCPRENEGPRQSLPAHPSVSIVSLGRCPVDRTPI
jgi:hypothetical protein